MGGFGEGQTLNVTGIVKLTADRYLPGVDALRVLAIAAVLVQHWCYPYLHLLPARINAGRLGVNLFFVISGFLITGILLRAIARSDGSSPSKSQILKAFYARRFLRIFPLYYACIGVAILCGVSAVKDYWYWHILYLTNVHNCLFETPFPATHFWSLAIEEQFYLLWPLVILSVPTRAMAPFLIGSIALRPVTSFALTSCGAESLMDASPLGGIHMLGHGSILAWLVHKDVLIHKQKQLVTGVTAAATYTLLYLSEVFPASNAFRELYELATAICFTGSVYYSTLISCDSHSAKILAKSGVLYLGSISYGLYLIHNFVPDLVRSLLTCLGFSPAAFLGKLQVPVFLTVTIGLASLSWLCFEKPINQLKSRFPYISTRGSLPTA